MINRTSKIRPGLINVILLLILGFSFSLQAADDELLEQIIVLDEKYQQLIADYYASAVGSAVSADSIEQLLAQVKSISGSEHPLQATRLLVAHFDRIRQSAEHPAIIELTEFLLQQNERQLVDQIYQLVEDSAAETNRAYISFNLAKYHSRLNQWEQVSAQLEDNFSELASDDSDYAYLLQGSALQYLKQHRLATESYAKIPESSRYFVHAQLNTAIASIRQGWITDARLKINSIIPAARRSDSEMTNRIYLVLGYALLNKEYFRDARDAFRQINRDSQYTNKALLGIALTAINQGDYVGGLNALNLLKARRGRDLSVDEAYLLLPHVYQRLNQANSIESSFLESIDHYQLRLLEINELKRREFKYEDLSLEKESGDIFLNEVRFPFSQHYPFYLLKNRNNLHYLSRGNAPSQLSPRIGNLLAQYDATLERVLSELIEQKKQLFTSYLNQSRYGLARHYDESQQGTQ